MHDAVPARDRKATIAFKAGAHLVGGLVGGDDAFDVYGDAFAVTVNETEAERSDLPIGVRAGDHLYGCIEPKI